MEKIPLTILSILLAAGLILSVCASQSAWTAQSTLGGTSWILVSYGSAENQTPAAAGVPTSLIFAADGRVSGNLGCNGFSGNYKVKDGKLVFGPLASTLMACPELQMTQEGSTFQVLTGTVLFTMTGNTLTIYAAGGAVALTLSRVVN